MSCSQKRYKIWLTVSPALVPNMYPRLEAKKSHIRLDPRFVPTPTTIPPASFSPELKHVPNTQSSPSSVKQSLRLPFSEARSSLRAECTSLAVLAENEAT